MAACMTEVEQREWGFWNSKTAKPADSPCRDCTKAFALEMREQGQCDGTYPREGRSKPSVTTSDEPYRKGRGPKSDRALTQAEKMKAKWADPEFRAEIMRRRKASKKVNGVAAHKPGCQCRSHTAAAS